MASMDGTRIIPRRYCCRSLLYLPPLLTVLYNGRFVSFLFPLSKKKIGARRRPFLSLSLLSTKRRTIGWRVEKFAQRKSVMERFLEIDCRRVPSTRQSIEYHLSSVIVEILRGFLHLHPLLLLLKRRSRRRLLSIMRANLLDSD